MSPTETRFPHLLSPLQVGPKQLRNRLLVTGHVPRLAKDNRPTQAYIDYHRARAKGGAGLQITGASAVHVTGTLGNPYGLQVLDDGIVPGYQALAEAVHGEGGCILAQLAHSAATLNISDAGRPLWAPSAVSSELAREVPHEMTTAEIAELVEAYAAAAARVKAGGLDGVEILAAFGFLVGAFFSPRSNQRQDRYGGSLNNRLRFAREVIEATRGGLGADRILGMRIPGDEGIEGGLGPDEMVEIAQALSADGTIDFLNVIYGSNYDRLGRMRHWPPTPAPHGLFVPLAAAIKAAVEIPVFTTGRITDPRLAEEILRDGKADMIGMTRAHIADPEIGRKVADGRPEDIRPCVGANVCISLTGGPLRCFHNPFVGREQEWGPVTPATTPKRVAVIGGGPAGLEAARLAAERGHAVTLYEAAPTLGGQLRLWATAPEAGEFAKSLEWYERQLQKHQVRVELGQRVGADDLPKLEADTVILATGSYPDEASRLDGGDVTVVPPQTILADPPVGVARAVVINECNGHTGLSAARLLAERGAAVTVVTAAFVVGEDIDPVVRTPLYEFLLSRGVVLRPNERAVRTEGRDLILHNLYTAQESRLEDLDMIVDWHGNQVVDDLLLAAQTSDCEMHQIGDCVSPRTVHIAVAEGAMVARQI